MDDFPILFINWIVYTILCLARIALESPTFAHVSRPFFYSRRVIKVDPLIWALSSFSSKSYFWILSYIMGKISSCALPLLELSLKNSINLRAASCETMCPWEPCPSATAKRWVPLSISKATKLSWFVFAGLLASTPCLVLCAYLMDRSIICEVFFNVFLDF